MSNILICLVKIVNDRVLEVCFIGFCMCYVYDLVEIILRN